MKTSKQGFYMLELMIKRSSLYDEYDELGILEEDMGFSIPSSKWSVTTR